MDGVQFEDTPVLANYYQDNQEPQMIKLLIKSGIAKNKKQANIFLLTCVVVFLTISAYLFAGTIEGEPEIIPYNSLTESEKNKIPVDERLFIERNLQTNTQPQK